MKEINKTAFLSEWQKEIFISGIGSNALCIAVFSEDGNLLFANEAIKGFLKDRGCSALINPSFESLLSLPVKTDHPVFSGIITFEGDPTLNTSIEANVFRKNDQIMIAGGVNVNELLRMNQISLELNSENQNLQRQLMKEKHLLDVSNEKLRISNASKDKLFSIIAHDLRSPFAGFLGLTGELASDVDSFTQEELKELASDMNKSANRIFDLLTNLLDWSRMQIDRYDCNMIRIDLHKEVEKIILLFSPLASSKSISLINNCAPGVFILADTYMFSSIVRNLISNAVKFTKKDGVIEIRSELTGREVEISVIDNGIGMSEETLGKLFKVESVYTTLGTNKEKGTGLGLALIAELIEKNGGSYNIKSVPDKGTEFTFTLKKAE